jgi:hypothetical protein
MDQSTISPKELISFLRASIFAADFLSTSNKPSDVVRMEKIINNLHAYRKKYPQYRSIISKALFKVFDNSFYNSSEYMKQRVQVSVIYGFTLEAPNDMNTLKELIKRMGLAKKPQNMGLAFRKITEHTLDIYNQENYQHYDSNRSIAYLLQSMIMTVNNFSGKKTIPEQLWLYENAKKLAKAQPIFKEFSKSFKKPKPVKKTFKMLPCEPAEVYPRSRKIKNRFSSHSYE